MKGASMIYVFLENSDLLYFDTILSILVKLFFPILHKKKNKKKMKFSIQYFFSIWNQLFTFLFESGTPLFALVLPINE